jgi:hypothetical protein
MTTHQGIKATAIAGLALSMGFGLSTAPAHAAPNLSVSCHIVMRPVSDGKYTDGFPAQQSIDVQGVVTMSQAAAQDSINHGYTVQLRYWGRDPSSDDLLYGPIAAPNVFAAADGLHYQHNVALAHSVLDEDNTLGVMDDSWGVATEEDEIYVGARFLDPSGKTVSLMESNRIDGTF